MKRGLCALVLAGLLASPVQAAPSFWAPSPLTIVLQVGKWIMMDREEVYHVRVRAVGRDEQDARDQAFRLAVEQAVGSLLLSHTNVRDGEVRRNEIINYSSGHIHDFKIQDRQYDGQRVSIDIDVWVRKSGIADRLLSQSRDAGRVEGGRISAQIDSFHREKHGADRVLSAVLADFPARAFDITVAPTRVLADNRVIYLQVPVHVRWNSKFTASLAEAVKTVNPRPDCNSWLANCRARLEVMIGSEKAYFDDETTYWIFEKAMVSIRPMLMMSLVDSAGRPVYRDCFDLPEISQSSYASWYFVDVGGGRVKLWPGNNKTFNLLVDTRNLVVENIDRAEVQAVPGNQCPR